ncbi:MAG: hypothetical protein WDN31_11965 [Hyphomicrobium sp.]
MIHDTTLMMSWDDWCRAAGLNRTPAFTGPTYDDPALAYDAAISGQGVLLSVDMMSADSVSDGRLARPFALPVDSTPLGYWLAVPEGGASRARCGCSANGCAGKCRIRSTATCRSSSA